MCLHVVEIDRVCVSSLRVFMLLSCIGQRSLSNSGVLEGLLNLLDSLLSPLQQPMAAAHRRTEGGLAGGGGSLGWGWQQGWGAGVVPGPSTGLPVLWTQPATYECVSVCAAGVLDVPMISWVVMLVSRLLDYVASVEDEASAGKKHLGGKETERTFTGSVV